MFNQSHIVKNGSYVTEQKTKNVHQIIILIYLYGNDAILKNTGPIHTQCFEQLLKFPLNVLNVPKRGVDFTPDPKIARLTKFYYI